MKTLHEIEKEALVNAVRAFGNDKIKAAEALGITVKRLYGLLHEHGLLKYNSELKIFEEI